MGNVTETKSSQVVDQSVDKDHLNYLNSMQDAPAVRLEAEFFQADDIEGAAESAAGAGNLNYLVLQSQQTNDASALNDPFQVMSNDDVFGRDALGGGASAGDVGGRSSGNLSDDDNSMNPVGNDDNSFGINSMTGGSDMSSQGTTSLSIAGASALKARSFNDGSDANSSIDITNIDTPDTPDNPEDPDDPDDPTNPPEDDLDLDVDIDTPIVDIDLDGILDPIEDIVGDIDIDIDAIVDNLLPGDHGLLPDIDAAVDAVFDGTTLIGIGLDEIVGPLDPVVSGATDLVDGVISGVEDMLPDELIQPIQETINTVLDLTGLGADDGDTDLLLNLGSAIPGFIVFNTAFDIPLNPVELLLGDIDITADAQTLAENLGTHTFSLLGDLQQQDMSSVLDTVVGEDSILQDTGSLIPELVFGLDVATDILPDFSDSVSTDNLLENVTNVTEGILPAGDLLGGDTQGSDFVADILGGLPGNDQTSPGEDIDLVVVTGIDILGVEVPDISQDVVLDPIESLVGDIDINLDIESATDIENVESILSDAMAGDIEGIIDDIGTDMGLDTHLDMLGDNDLSIDILPDNLGDITNGADSFTELSDAVGSLLGSQSIPDVLPDPVGTLTEGIGQVIDTTPVLGGLGGLLGGGGGGLFG